MMFLYSLYLTLECERTYFLENTGRNIIVASISSSDFDTDCYLVLANVRERLAASK
jgi:hypothetical protein